MFSKKDLNTQILKFQEQSRSALSIFHETKEVLDRINEDIEEKITAAEEEERRLKEGIDLMKSMKTSNKSTIENINKILV